MSENVLLRFLLAGLSDFHFQRIAFHRPSENRVGLCLDVIASRTKIAGLDVAGGAEVIGGVERDRLGNGCLTAIKFKLRTRRCDLHAQMRTAPNACRESLCRFFAVVGLAKRSTDQTET